MVRHLQRAQSSGGFIVGLTTAIVLSLVAIRFPAAYADGGTPNALNAQPVMSVPTGPQDILQQKLGVSAEGAAQILSDAKAGTLTPAEQQLLCAHIAAAKVPSDQIQAIGASMGLSAALISQVQSCAQSAGQAPAQSQSSASPLSTPAAAQTAAAQPAASSAEAAPSAIEQSFRQIGANEILPEPQTKSLTQYGYSLFASPVSTFAPVANVPVGPDYLVGPGDNLNVLIWGSINQTLSLEVQRDGAVAIPQVGPLNVAGLTFGDAKKLLEGRIEQINGAHAQVTMGQLRTISVFVLGNVAQPGAYTVSALSRVSNVLAAAGGISRVGSLRRVELRRGGRTVERLDLYRMLMHGDTGADVRLQPDDVIFVPVIGPVVAVTGDVNVPAIYELRSSHGADLSDVLRLAGGTTAFSSSHRVTVIRVRNHAQVVALDVSGKRLKASTFRVMDGDLVEVYPVVTERRNIVTLSGNVYRPGQYQWHPGLTVADLLRDGEGIKKDTFLSYGLIKRQQGVNRTTSLTPFNLGEVLDSGAMGSADKELQPLDEVVILTKNEVQSFPHVTINGDVNKPGSYPWTTHMRLSDLVYMAGGFTDSADRGQLELDRTRVVDGSKTQHINMTVDLNQSGQQDKFGPYLETNDQVFVHQATNWHLPWVVTVSGRVARPGEYSIHTGETLASVLQRAGGFLPDGYPGGIVFTRDSVREIEQKRLDQAREQLKQGVAQVALGAGSLAEASGGSSGGVSAALMTLQNVLQSSQNLQADGRVVVHVDTLPALESDRTNNVALQEHDSIIVPIQPSSVNVLGQVYEPTSVLASKALTVRDCLARAGGITQYADPDAIMLVKADGTVVTDAGIKQTEPNRFFPLVFTMSGGVLSRQVEAGDTIYVPAEIQTFVKLEYAKAITEIISRSVMSMAIVGILAGSI